MEQPLRMQASSSYEPYSYEQNGPALIGNVGRWLDTDDFLGEWPKQGSSAAEDDNSWLVEFPRGWPSVFKESAALRTLVNKKLRGTRCRAVEPATAADRAAAKALTLRPLHSFDNALALSEVLGWSLVKGFLVLERTASEADAADTSSDAKFVAVRHWWNARADGAWVDLTPPWTPPLPGREGRMLLVESERGEKLAAPLTKSARDFSIAIVGRLVRAGAMRLAQHLLSGGELPQAFGGGVKDEAAATVMVEPAKRDASNWSSYESNKRWDQLELSDDEEESTADSARVRAKEKFDEDVRKGVEAAQSASRRATSEASSSEEEPGGEPQLTDVARKIKSAGRNLTTITKDDLGRFASAAEVEQDRVDAYEMEVVRAKERLAEDRYTDKWGRSSDLALVADAEGEQEDKPITRTQDMLRQMMGGTKEDKEERERRQGDTEPLIEEISQAAQEEEAAAATSTAAAAMTTRDASAAASMAPIPRPKPPPPRQPPSAPAEPGEHVPPSTLQIPPSFGSDRDAEASWRVAAAENSKSEGNDAFRRRDLITALRCYGRSLALLGQVEALREQLAVDVGDCSGSGAEEAEVMAKEAMQLAPPPDARELKALLRQRGLSLLVSIHSNRSASLLNADRPSEAEKAASAAIVLSPSDQKARRRRAAALTVLGRHKAACDDLSAAWRVRKSADLATDLAESWAMRMPSLRTLADAAKKKEGATFALISALIGGSGVRARDWITQNTGGASALANLKPNSCLSTMIDAAADVSRSDADGTIALLRAASWVVGVSPMLFEIEAAMCTRLTKRFDELAFTAEREAVNIGAMHLAQALCMRRVANCPWVPLQPILTLYTTGKSGPIRAAAEGCLVWLSRHPETVHWLHELSRERAEPLILKCRSFYESLNLKERHGTGWAMGSHDLRTRCEEDTGLCVSDAGL